MFEECISECQQKVWDSIYSLVIIAGAVISCVVFLMAKQICDWSLKCSYCQSHPWFITKPVSSCKYLVPLSFTYGDVPNLHGLINIRDFNIQTYTFYMAD